MEWAAGLDLFLLNCGNVSTCVRRQGESVVDFLWASPPTAMLVENWRVMDEEETLSNHRYLLIRFCLSMFAKSTSGRGWNILPASEDITRNQLFRRWAVRKINQNLLLVAAHVVAWPERP